MGPVKILAVLVFLAFLVPNLALAQEVYKVGDKNQKIAAVQKDLPALGIKVDRSDGVFSINTSKAVKKFQKKFKKQYKLKTTGLLDETTYNAIRAEAAKKGGQKPITTGTIGSGKASDIVKTAAQYKGVPYRFGGTTPSGFDCSGYIMYVFGQHNIKTTRSADTQFKEGVFVLKKDLRPGDLVFFETYEKGASHAGIYAGSGKFWHASSSKGVMLSGLEENYWKKRYLGSRRIIS